MTALRVPSCENQETNFSRSDSMGREDRRTDTAPVFSLSLYAEASAPVMLLPVCSLLLIVVELFIFFDNRFQRGIGRIIIKARSRERAFCDLSG